MKYLSLIVSMNLLTACSPTNMKANIPEAQPKPEATVPPVASTGSADSIESETYSSESTTEIILPPKKAEVVASCTAAGANIIESAPQKLTFAERTQGCNFGVAPNLAAENATLTSMESTKQSVTLPKGIICSMTINSESSEQFKYDDMMVMALDSKNILFASTDNLFKFLDAPIEGIYTWNWQKLVGHKDSEGLQFHSGDPYCLSTSTCKIPHTEQTGPVEVSLDSSNFSSIASSIFNKEKVDLELITMGDDDATDCKHAELKVDVAFKYIPAP